jgi:hypothetical protein
MKEETAHPRTRHDESIRTGDGSRSNEKYPGSKARILDSEAVWLVLYSAHQSLQLIQ